MLESFPRFIIIFNITTVKHLIFLEKIKIIIILNNIYVNLNLRVITYVIMC